MQKLRGCRSFGGAEASSMVKLRRYGSCGDTEASFSRCTSFVFEMQKLRGCGSFGDTEASSTECGSFSIGVEASPRGARKLRPRGARWRRRPDTPTNPQKLRGYMGASSTRKLWGCGSFVDGRKLRLRGAPRCCRRGTPTNAQKLSR